MDELRFQHCLISCRRMRAFAALCLNGGSWPLAIKVGKTAFVVTSTPHQPASAGFAQGLRLNVGQCG